MKYIQLGKSGLTVPSVALGCMRIRDVSAKEAEELVATALELGCNFFEHADIYGQGTCEEAFADAIHMSPSVRDKILLQSKCGIVSGVMYDFSKEHILSSVDGILKRLRTDYLDVLVLHRPDALMEPEEVAEATTGPQDPLSPAAAKRQGPQLRCFQPQIQPDQAAAEIYQPAPRNRPAAVFPAQLLHDPERHGSQHDNRRCN